MLKINGAAITTPMSFKVSINDLDGESNRNAKGELVRDRIAVKRKLECTWGPLTSVQSSVLLQAVAPVFFEVTYPDPMTGTEQTKIMYVGDRSMPVYMVKNGQVLWEGLEMNFVER